MAEHLNQSHEEIPDGFAAMGKPIHQLARQMGYAACRDMGLQAGPAWLATNGMAEQLERDRPYEGQRVAMRYMDLTGAYRLMATLLTAALQPAPPADPELVAELEKLRVAQAVHIKRLKDRGKTVLSFLMPCCGNTSESLAGPETGQWDTLATCEHCGEIYMKVSTASAIEARMLEEQEDAE